MSFHNYINRIKTYQKFLDEAKVGDRISNPISHETEYVHKCRKCHNNIGSPTLKYGNLFNSAVIKGDKMFYSCIYDHCEKCRKNLCVEIRCCICKRKTKCFKYDHISAKLEPPIVCIESKCIQEYVKVIESCLKSFISNNNVTQMISHFLEISIINDWKLNEKFSEECW